MSRPSLVALTGIAGAVVALDLDAGVLRAVLALLLLLGLPTLLLFRRLRFLDDHSPARLLYALGCSLLGLMLLGLALNTVLPEVGVERPLRPAVLGLAATVVNVALLAWPGGRRPAPDPAGRTLTERAFAARLEPSQALAAASLALAVLGAVRLNNGAGPGLAVTALAVGVAALLALLLRKESTDTADVSCLVLVAAGLLLATSLRGWTITGHDIWSEYLTFRLTNEAQHWEMGHWQNAYNACLSLNILPTAIVQATGLSGVLVFKVLVPALFALVPGLNFLLARRFVTRRLAVAAAIFTLALPTFYTDMPYMVRQEVAFYFLALMLLASTAPARRSRRLLLVAVLGAGVVVSHYSTTYLLLIGLTLGLLGLGGRRAVQLLRRWRGDRAARPAAGRARGRLVLLHPLLIVFLALASWAWAGPVTHTGGHAAQVARDAVAAILSGQAGPGSSDLSYSLFAGEETSARDRLDLFVDETLRVRKLAPRDALLVKRPGNALVRPPIVEPSRTPPTAIGTAMKGTGLAPHDLVTGLRFGAAGVLQVLLLVGLFRLLRVIRHGRAEAEEGIPAEAVFVAFGTVAALGLIVVVPELSVDYGVLRGLEQTLLVVSPVVALGLWRLAGVLRGRASMAAIAVPIVLLAVFSGLVSAAIGGYSPRLALSNSGPYYDRYYVSDSDVSAVGWLTSAARGSDPAPRMVANRNLGVRLLSRDPGAVVDDRLFPTLLARGDYVLVDSRLQESHRSAVFYTGDLISYRYPLRAVERRLDLVYSSQRTRVYR